VKWEGSGERERGKQVGVRTEALSATRQKRRLGPLGHLSILSYFPTLRFHALFSLSSHALPALLPLLPFSLLKPFNHSNILNSFTLYLLPFLALISYTRLEPALPV
jgi:hypothetical protein